MEQVIEKLDIKIEEMDNALKKLMGADLSAFPIQSYLDEFSHYSDDRYYNYFSDTLRKSFRKIKESFNHEGLWLYQKCAFAHNIRNAVTELQKRSYPIDIKKLYEQWFRNAIDELSEKEDSFFSVENDMFVKDMGVTSFRIIPAGAQILCVSGVSRGFIKSNNPFSVIKRGLYFVLKMKKFRPFIEIHTDNRWLHEFNPEGWNRCYVRIAHILRQNTEILGMVGCSWFYDPQLSMISPHLEYLRKVPQENGAGVFRVPIRQYSINDALLKSKTRKKLYEKGEYSPRSYLVIWCRDDLIKWADSYEKNNKVLFEE